jgi:hypothetical protein
MAEVVKNRQSERGGAGAKLLLAFSVIILIANAGYNYVPVAYQGESFKQDMEGAIIKGTAFPSVGKAPLNSVKLKLLDAAKSNAIPDDAVLEVKQNGQTIVGFASYSRNVEILPFGLYVYTYHFEHSSTPAGFVIKKS